MIIDMDTYDRMCRPPIEIRLNGIVVHHTFAADEDNGFVDYYKYPFEINEHRNAAISFRSFGDVEIILGDAVRGFK